MQGQELTWKKKASNKVIGISREWLCINEFKTNWIPFGMAYRYYNMSLSLGRKEEIDINNDKNININNK